MTIFFCYWRGDREAAEVALRTVLEYVLQFALTDLMYTTKLLSYIRNALEQLWGYHERKGVLDQSSP
jgi:hypothetical protein